VRGIIEWVSSTVVALSRGPSGMTMAVMITPQFRSNPRLLNFHASVMSPTCNPLRDTRGTSECYQSANKGWCVDSVDIPSLTRHHQRSFYRVYSTQFSTLRIIVHEALHQLSKKYHPDLNSDSTAQGKFRAISEAYAILGHDRERCVDGPQLPHSNL